MSVLIETSGGTITVDLMTEECPRTCENFLKLCKSGYYNGCLFWNVQSDYIAQSGDPTGTGRAGESSFSLFGNDKKGSGFVDEIMKGRSIDRPGLLCMAHAPNAKNENKSQFFITLRGHDMEYLEEKHTIFGEVVEGQGVMEKINVLYTDEEGRPYEDFRIKRIGILEDPYQDPEGFFIINSISSAINFIPPEETVKQRIVYQGDTELLEEMKTLNKQKQRRKTGELDKEDAIEDIEETMRKKEAHSRAIVLEMTGDLPDADVKPPEEALFVCKLNPVTNDEDLELIFSRFGNIVKCAIVRDEITGDSLNYAFIEFASKEACVRAYQKMDNVLIDDRRIKVDFSQSVSGLWNRHLQQKRKSARKTLRESIGRTTQTDGSRAQLESTSGGHAGGLAESRRLDNHGDHGRRRDMDCDKDNRTRPNRDRDRGFDRDRDRDRRYDRDRDRDRHFDRDRDRDRRYDRDRDRNFDRDRDRHKKERLGDREGRRDLRSRSRSRSRDYDRRNR